MAIIRSPKDEKYTVIDNAVFERNQLSWRAMGLLAYVLSKPNNWSIHINELVAATKGTDNEVGEKVVYGILNALIEKGFVHRQKHQSGKIDYTFFDQPTFPDRPNGKQPNPQTAESADSRKPDFPLGYALVSTERQTSTEEKKVSTDLPDGDPSAPVENLPAVADKKKASSPNPDNVATWNAYRQAYANKYGCEPLRNAQVNGQIARLVKSVPANVAPALAAYYVNHNNGFYVQKRHPIGLLLSDAQGIYTDMMRNEQMTAAKARQQEGTQTNMSAYEQAKAMRQQKQGANHG